MRAVALFALWSAPRARSTAFFRSMIERGDMVVVHEPFSDLAGLGETDVGGQVFHSAERLLEWMLDRPPHVNVFVKDTTGRRHEPVLADVRFLTVAHHAFLIRRPDEIAASSAAIEPNMGIDAIGLEGLWELHEAVIAADGHPPVVIDSDDLVTRPAATMAAYCAAVGLAFVPQALVWERGDRHECRRSARWHVDVSASTGFTPRRRTYARTVDTSEELARYAAHHVPFYERLHAQRLRIEP